MMTRVIVVVEGPSAAGKTTWCMAHGYDRLVAEAATTGPPADSSAVEHAQCWGDINCRRWADALQVEAERGLAVCDTDPLKLHYDYCLAHVGFTSWERFDAGVAEAAAAIARRQLGIADLLLVDIPDDETLTRRRDSDKTRNRRRFDLHRRLGPGLRDWYGTLARIDPGRVRWQYPPELPSTIERDRYDADLFRAWMNELPRSRTVIRHE